MLEILRVREAPDRSRPEENGHHVPAMLDVLFRQELTATKPFVEIRQWTTLDGNTCGLVSMQQHPVNRSFIGSGRSEGNGASAKV
jgi:hypothetical protein